MTSPTTDVDPDELDRLRLEVSALRAKLDTRRRRAAVVPAIRRVTAAVLVAISAFALVLSTVGVWAAKTAFDTDRWVATVAPLPRDPQISAAMAEYTTNELFRVLDVENRLREVLPDRAAFVVGPLTGQIRGVVRNTVHDVLVSDRFQRIWVEANRRVHERAIAILKNQSSLVVVRDDRIEIDLLPLVNQVLRQLSANLPTMFGKQISLPDLSSSEIPDNLRTRVEDAVGVSLPQNFARFTVYDAGKLAAVQDAVATARRDLILFVVSTIALLLLALIVSPGRRRTLLQFGLWLVVAAVVVTAVLRRVRGELLLEVPSGLYRDAVDATFTSVFAGLRTRGTQLIWIGAVLALLMYLIGPGRIPVWLRGRIAWAARGAGHGVGSGARAVAARGPGWTARHLDAVRVGAVVVAALFALILSSWLSLLVIVVLTAAFEVLVTVLARRVDTTEPETPAPAPPPPPPSAPSAPQPTVAG